MSAILRPAQTDVIQIVQDTAETALAIRIGGLVPETPKLQRLHNLRKVEADPSRTLYLRLRNDIAQSAGGFDKKALVGLMGDYVQQVVEAGGFIRSRLHLPARINHELIDQQRLEKGGQLRLLR